jgi:hypothetical protein
MTKQLIVNALFISGRPSALVGKKTVTCQLGKKKWRTGLA